MSTRRSRAGFTLIELVTAVLIGGLMIATAGSIWFYSNRSFAAQLNYVDMDQASQMALDTISREIRETKALVSESKRRLEFIDSDGDSLSYEYVKEDRILYRVKAGVTNVLLRNCKDLDFAIYQRNPVAGSYDQYPAADASNCKLVQVSWVCSRPLYGTGQENTEAVSSAKIVIRNP